MGDNTVELHPCTVDGAFIALEALRHQRDELSEENFALRVRVNDLETQLSEARAERRPV